jgi:hypothetical protein
VTAFGQIPQVLGIRVALGGLPEFVGGRVVQGGHQGKEGTVRHLVLAPV